MRKQDEKKEQWFEIIKHQLVFVSNLSPLVDEHEADPSLSSSKHAALLESQN